MSEPMRVVFWCEGHPLDGARRSYPGEVAEIATLEYVRDNYVADMASGVTRKVTWRDSGILDQGDRVFVREQSRRLGGGGGDT